MPGAIALAGMAALRGGSGLVTLAVPEGIQQTVAGYEPGYMTIALPEESRGEVGPGALEELEARLDDLDGVGLGPGLGQGESAGQLVLQLYQQLPCPLVLDADALNLLAGQCDGLEAAGPRIFTPHPGEFRRLLGSDLSSRDALETAAVDWAARQQAVLVLKGYQSLVTDGEQSFHNTSGNAGMATGGSGDVLTGLLVALLCQGLPPLDAARLAVYLHGLAGDLAAEELGQQALIASDLVDFLGPAFLQYLAVDID
jgi:NAD(P)H-hydrate epimerase